MGRYRKTAGPLIEDQPEIYVKFMSRTLKL